MLARKLNIVCAGRQKHLILFFCLFLMGTIGFSQTQDALALIDYACYPVQDYREGALPEPKLRESYISTHSSEKQQAKLLQKSFWNYAPRSSRKFPAEEVLEGGLIEALSLIDYACYAVREYAEGELPLTEFRIDQLNPLQRGGFDNVALGELLAICTPVVKGETLGSEG